MLTMYEREVPIHYLLLSIGNADKISHLKWADYAHSSSLPTKMTECVSKARLKHKAFEPMGCKNANVGLLFLKDLWSIIDSI